MSVADLPAQCRVDVVPLDPKKPTDTYLCGFAEARDGFLILSRAHATMGNPHSPHDRIMIPAHTIGHAVVNYLSEDDRDYSKDRDV